MKKNKPQSTIRVYVRKQKDRDSLTLYYYDPVTRRVKSRSAGSADRKAAERAAADWERELLDFLGSDGSGWQAFRQRFRDEHLAFKADNTRAAYQTALTSFENFAKPTTLNSVTTSLLSGYASSLAKAGKPHATVKSYLTHLRAAFRWAERMELMRKAPHATMPPMANRKHMRGRPLTWREVGKLLRGCRRVWGQQADPWRFLVKLLWYTGLRLGEALALSWDTPPLIVRLDSKPFPLVLIEGEGTKNRTDTAMPLTPDCARWLERIPDPLRTGYLVRVVNAAGNRYSAEKLSDEVSRIGKASGAEVDGESPTAHDLRRTFATRWASKVRPMTLQRMLRHSDLSTTLRFYVGLSVEDIGAELWK